MTDSDSERVTQAVREIIASVLRVDRDSVDGLRLRQTLAWDSIAQVEIVFQLEERFGVEFDESQLLSIHDLDSATTAVIAKRELGM